MGWTKNQTYMKQIVVLLFVVLSLFFFFNSLIYNETAQKVNREEMKRKRPRRKRKTLIALMLLSFGEFQLQFCFALLCYVIWICLFVVFEWDVKTRMPYLKITRKAQKMHGLKTCYIKKRENETQHKKNYTWII